jgi:hypothetical protein
MKLIKTLIPLLVITFLSSPSWGEALGHGDLVKNPSDGLVYKKFTTIPFTWSISPTAEEPSGGSYKDGMKHGLWKIYNNDGALQNSMNYRDGKLIE